MEGDGMVAVVRGLREAGLAVTLLDGNRQYTLLPNTTTQPASTQHATAQCPPKFTADTSTEPATPQCDRDAQAIDGRYASMYKTMHCNMHPTSPPVQLTEFPPQRPDVFPGHGNFIVGGSGSGANGCPIRPSSPITSFRGGMSWPDRGSVCSPRASRMEDAFARSLRKYPNCLSPDRSSEVMERLVNYSQAKGSSRNYRNSSSPNRSSEPSSQNVLESKGTFNVSARSRSYEPEVNIRAGKNEDPPTRDMRNDDCYDRPVRGCYDVRYLRDMTKRMREGGGRSYTSYSYNHSACPPTIRETHDYHPLSCEYQNSSNSVNMEIQAAVKMLSKEVATLPRADVTRKTVAVPESPISSAGEDYVEGEFYYVENMDIRTSIKSIQTNFYASDTTLKPRKSAQTVFSTIDFHSSRSRTIVSRKTKSQEAIKLTKDELKISLLELINEISDTVSKNTIRDELIKKLFDTSERTDHICDRVKIKHDKCHKYVADCPTVCDHVGDYQELVGKLKYCYGDAKNVLRSEIKPFRLSEYRQLDFVLKDWVNHLNLKTDDISRSIDRRDLLNSVEDRIKGLLKNWTKEDFDLKSEIVDILQEIPLEVNKSYGMKSYLRKLVDVLLKRMRNVIVTEQTGRVRRRPFASRSKKILTEEDMRDFVREHLMNYANESNSRISNDTLYDLENELVDLMMDSIECIWCGHDDEIMDEMEIILQDLGKISNKHAYSISNLMLQDLQDMLNNCVFNQTYTILNVSNNSGQYMNSTNNTDVSIGYITEADLQVNLDLYTNQLNLQINQWLDGLNILQNEDFGFREVVVNELARDIIDRHKYVELNHTGRVSDQDQLEVLKYQIFKWINKLVGDDNQETINHAENLLQRINSVPVPMLVYPKYRCTGGAQVYKSACPYAGRSIPKPYSQPVQSKPSCGKETCPNTPKDGKGINKIGQFGELNSFPNAVTSEPQKIQGQTGRGPQTCNASRPQVQSSLNNSRACGRGFGPASPNNPWGSNSFPSGFTGNFTQPRQGTVSSSGIGTCIICKTNQPTMHDPNQSMNASSPNRPGGSVPVKKLNEDYDEYLKQWVKKIPIAEITAEESARLNVYNGIWKAVTMMKLDPNIFGNQYFCQDVLEEEIERLLQDVPQSQELEAAKPALKAQLLQKTLAMNDLIKSTNAPASFKQQLMDNIENNLPERAPTENEEEKANDELDKQNMADYYILYTRYKNEDNVKASVHRKNFLKKLDEYLNKIKNRHNLVDMETTAYANEIINSLEKVPTPNLSTIKDEADEILLAMEVENWISDIPQNTSVGPIEKRRLRDAIVKKIQEISSRGINFCDNAFRVALKAELPKNLEKISILEGTNKDYLIDELANRIKNLLTSIRRVSFQEPEDYEEFSRNMPCASSMHEMTGDRTSDLIAGENIVKCSPKQLGMRSCEGRQDSVLEEDIQWLSMDRTEVPSQMRSGYEAPQCRQSPQVYNPNESGQMPQRPQSPQMYASNAPDCGAPPGRCNVSGGNISRDAGLNRTWGSERAPVPQKRQKMSMQESRASPCARNRFGRPEIARSQLYNPNDSLAGRSYQDQGTFVGTDGSPRLNWAGGQTPVPEEEIQSYSMEVPSQMRSMSIASSCTRSSPVCRANSADQAANQRSYPGSSQVPNIFIPNTQAPFVHARDVPFSSFPPPPTTQGQFPPNLQGHGICTGPPCCPNPLCNNRTQCSLGSGPPSTPQSPGPRGPYGQGSPQGFPNVQGSLSGNISNAAQSSPLPQGQFAQDCPGRFNQSVGSPRSGPYSQPAPQTPGPRGPHGQGSPQGFPNVHGSPSGNIPNAAQTTPLPQGEFAQGCPGRFNQSVGSPGSGPYSQPAPQSPGPRGPHGQGCPQGFPNVQGSPSGNIPIAAQTTPLPQGEFAQGCPGRFNQSVGSPGSGPYSQPAPQSPGPRGPHGQGCPQGFPNVQGSPSGNIPIAAQTSPLPQGQFAQGCPGRFNQSVGSAFGPVNIQNGSLSGGQKYPQGQPFQGPHYQTPPGVGQGQAQVFPNNTLRQSVGPNAPCDQGCLEPGGQMPYQGPMAPQLGQAKPNVPGSSQNCPASIGVIEGSGQGFSIAQPNACQGQATLNQTSQSPGPISAASQVPQQAPRPINLKVMADGRMGLLSTSQVPGPSSQPVVPTCSGPGATCYQTGPQRVGTDPIPAKHITTDDRSVQQPSNQNQSIQQPSCPNQFMQQPTQNQNIQQPSLTADKSLQAACLPAMFLGRPKGCFGPATDREREKCKCMRRGRKFRPRMQIDPNDSQMKYLPCRSRGYYPCFF